VRGTRRKVADNDLSSDSEDKSPHPRTSTPTRKGHLRAGRQGKSGRREIQSPGVALLPVSAGKRLTKGSEVVVPALRSQERE
jgi:hypothetical protein